MNGFHSNYETNALPASGLATISYENKLREEMGKATGILKPMDASGYRRIILGGIGLTNSGGQQYTDDREVIALFERSSNLQRRVEAGRLYAELGHPKMDGLDEEAFLVRILSLYEEKEIGHYRKIELVPGEDEHGRPCRVIYGEVRPSGPHAAVLEDKFNNGWSDTCFSIRCMTDVFRSFGRVQKRITEIITWDYVGEPGIAIASKYRTPATESFAQFSLETMVRARAKLEQYNVGLESNGPMEMIDRLIEARITNSRNSAPAAFNW